MNARDAQNLIDKLKSLPRERQAEVEDFVDFLRGRETDQQLTRAAARASESAFAKVWDNEDDAEYDRL
ncbi:MAG: toxin-antitoxin system, antitoxin component, Xre family protein [Steroidobacteraceae bacterium]